MKHLPEDRYKIGRMLFHHLAQIASYEASTKMTASNLATFWAPNLFAVSHGDSKDNHGRHRGKKVTSKNCSKIISEASMDISGMISVAEFIIRHSKTIFPVDE